MSYSCSKREKKHLFSHAAFSRKKIPSFISVCRRMYIQKVLPFAGHNGNFHLSHMYNCLSSYSLRKLLFPYSQPWDSFTSAIWVKSLSVSIPFRGKKIKPFPSARIDSVCKTPCQLITISRPCNPLNMFCWTFCTTRSHGIPLAMAPAQKSTHHLTDPLLLLMPIYSYAHVDM